jgi:hypothetical protein
MEIDGPRFTRSVQKTVRVRGPSSFSVQLIPELGKSFQHGRNVCLWNEDVDVGHHTGAEILVRAVEEVNRAFQKDRLDANLVQARSVRRTSALKAPFRSTLSL